MSDDQVEVEGPTEGVLEFPGVVQEEAGGPYTPVTWKQEYVEGRATFSTDEVEVEVSVRFTGADEMDDTEKRIKSRLAVTNAQQGLDAILGGTPWPFKDGRAPDS